MVRVGKHNWATEAVRVNRETKKRIDRMARRFRMSLGEIVARATENYEQLQDQTRAHTTDNV